MKYLRNPMLRPVGMLRKCGTTAKNLGNCRLALKERSACIIFLSLEIFEEEMNDAKGPNYFPNL